ncbi:MAG: glycoside hydrolase [Burkholderiaceae bacterium]|nr:glycoside hydrolase [Burkholderiaceae bacterium]
MARRGAVLLSSSLLSTAILSTALLSAVPLAAGAAPASGAAAARTAAGVNHGAGIGDTAALRIAEVAAHLAAPPDNARAMVRWWWFGPAVVNHQLEREMRAMKAGGYGGFEIQPVYPMALDDPARGIRNVPYLSPDFLQSLAFANRKGRELGLRVDLTLGSGWPYGGPHISAQHAASRMRVATSTVAPGATSYMLPAVMSGEALVASFIGAGTAKEYDVTQLRLTEDAPAPAPTTGRALVTPAAHERVAVFYIASRTGQQVKRPALGAEGFVLDHMDADAVQRHLDQVAAPQLKAFGQQPPSAVFSDSLEVYGSDWTGDFLAQFRRRRGYDLTPYLPQVYSGQGPDAPALRRDWALTQTELVNERFLAPINAWARAHGTRFRSQTYGEPAVSLSSTRLVDLPEGEGPQHRAFSFTRLATSGGHLFGRNVISAETWTWLNSPAFNASPLDMKAEADRMLLQGVNQFIGHGWPYTPPGAQEPGYAFYAAAVFNDHQPWWTVMPDVNRYLQRISYLMRQGRPANTVAVLLPNDDVYAALNPGKVSLSAEMHHHVTPELTAQILDAGHNLDYTDADAVLAQGIAQPVLVLPHVTRLAPQVLARIDAYAQRGGQVIAVGALPSAAPGFLDAQAVGEQVRAASQALATRSTVQVVPDDGALGAALARAVRPDLLVRGQNGDVGFIRRQLADADIYFIANTGNQPVRTSAAIAQQRRHAAWVNPHDGSARAVSWSGATQPGLNQARDVASKQTLESSPELALALAPYESTVLVLSDTPLPSVRPAAEGEPTVVARLDTGWQLTFPGLKQAAQPVAALRSWTDDDATRYYSGIGVYSRDVTLEGAALAGKRITLDFGPGTPLASTAKVPAGMRAMLEGPVREAAVVLVNGQRAGAAWCPPYKVDVTALLRPGRNRIEVQVANLALNALAGQERPDYRLLWARYGQRFVPQDTQLIAPKPSGMLGPVQLVSQNRESE